MSTLDLTNGGDDFVSFADVNLTASPFAASAEEIAPGITSLVESSQGNGETWYDSLARLLPTIAATYQQKQLLQVQVDRARAGLPPLNVSQYSSGMQLGLDQSTKTMLYVGGALLIGVLLLKNRKRN